MFGTNRPATKENKTFSFEFGKMNEENEIVEFIWELSKFVERFYDLDEDNGNIIDVVFTGPEEFYHVVKTYGPWFPLASRNCYDRGRAAFEKHMNRLKVLDQLVEERLGRDK